MRNRLLLSLKPAGRHGKIKLALMRYQPDRPRQLLAKTFLKRSVKMLERLSSAASTEALQSALSSPTDVGGVASLLSDLAPLGFDLSWVDPLAEAMARATVAKQELLKRAGGGLTSGQVATALGITRQAVDKRRSRRALLAVPTGSGEYLYPACQFTSEGVLPGLEKVLQAFQVENPWTQLSVLLAQAPALGRRSVLEAVKANELQKAVGVVASFGEQGA
jgi:hypothetical protein